MDRDLVIDYITRVNDYWILQNKDDLGNAFWERSVYHTGNIEAYKLTGIEKYRQYSERWAIQNNWTGHPNQDDKSTWTWEYSHDPNSSAVLFGDWQVCFQTYIDLYNLDQEPDPEKIARTLEVMGYQISKEEDDFWWWADGLYMVMPVMTKLYQLTKNEKYLDKLYEYFIYTLELLYDGEEGIPTNVEDYTSTAYTNGPYGGKSNFPSNLSDPTDYKNLFYRDANYVFPASPLPKEYAASKNFWSRGNSWVFAGLAKVLQDLPMDWEHRDLFLKIYKDLAKSIRDCQKIDDKGRGFWTQSMLVHDYSCSEDNPYGYETSGSALLTYGFAWGINNGILSSKEYLATTLRGWKYLTEVAIQESGKVCYVQWVGADAGKAAVYDNTESFAVGGILLAACEIARLMEDNDKDLTPVTNRVGNYSSSSTITEDGAWCWFADPRALRHINNKTSCDKTYIGYIDLTGNIQAIQYDNNTKEQEEVLVRSDFQMDDHNNPTFLVLPDGRIMIFYSEHTSSPYFYYRVTTIPEDITTLGPEKVIDTKGYGNTTYPSAFILSDQPEYFYLLWRGINWHPTVARLTLPDESGNVKYDILPKQIVDSRLDNQDTTKRPYAKYESDGKNKIVMTYTFTHPDNLNPNSLYYSWLDINTLTLHDATGNQLTDVNKAPFHINNKETNPAFLVDRTEGMRNWNWDIALDKEGNPLILFVRINKKKDEHQYYYAKWTGVTWRITKLGDGGGWFHQNEEKEHCYSGGMTMDHTNPSIVYASLPVEGQYGKVYEIFQYDIDDTGSIASVIPITKNSPKNNIRPFVVRNALPKDKYYLIWMEGDYYYWDNYQGRLGYTTSLRTNNQFHY